MQTRGWDKADREAFSHGSFGSDLGQVVGGKASKAKGKVDKPAASGAVNMHKAGFESVPQPQGGGMLQISASSGRASIVKSDAPKPQKSRPATPIETARQELEQAEKNLKAAEEKREEILISIEDSLTCSPDLQWDLSAADAEIANLQTKVDQAKNRLQFFNTRKYKK